MSSASFSFTGFVNNEYRKLKYFVIQFLLTHFGLFWWVVSNLPIISDVVERTIIRVVTEILEFPLPLSTNTPYTCLPSFTDHLYYNRLLPPRDSAQLPPIDRVAEIFKRPSSYPLDDWSSALFFSFAQWFVDQFLITDPRDPPKSYVKQLSQNLINLCTVYGDKPEMELVLRLGKGGRLKSQRINGEEYPAYINEESKKVLVSPFLEQLVQKSGVPVDWFKLFAVGHVRMNLQPGALIWSIIFLREHNRIADILQQENPSWDDERVFQTARNIAIVILMKIGLEDYVVKHIGFKLTYPLKFKPKVLFNADWYYNNQRIFIEFNHLYRWHSFVPNTIEINGKDYPLVVPAGNGQEELLWNTDFFTKPGSSLASIVTSYSRAPAAKFGLWNTHPFLVRMVEIPTLEAGRAAKLASYNDYRYRAGLWRFSSIDQITHDKKTVQKLKELYNNDVDQVEYYVGLMAENRGYGNSIFPALLAALVGAEAFRGIFGNPLLAPQVYNEATFTATGLKIIESSTLESLFKRNLPASSTAKKDYKVSFALKRKSWF